MGVPAPAGEPAMSSGRVGCVETGIGRHLVCDHQAAPFGDQSGKLSAPFKWRTSRPSGVTTRHRSKALRALSQRGFETTNWGACRCSSPQPRAVDSNRAGLEAAREAVERDPSPVRRPGGSSAGALAPDPAEPHPVRRDGVEAVADERDPPSVGRPPRPGLVCDSGSREAELLPLPAVRVHRHQVVVVPRIDRDDPPPVGRPVGARAGAHPADTSGPQVEHGDLLTSGAWGIERDPSAVRRPGGIFVVSADRREGGPPVPSRRITTRSRSSGFEGKTIGGGEGWRAPAAPAARTVARRGIASRPCRTTGNCRRPPSSLCAPGVRGP